MTQYCIRDLARIIGGRLRFGALPPLDGELAPVERIVLDWRVVEPGDVFWGIDAPNYKGSRYAEHAFIRGAFGVVVSGRTIEPWAGKFAIEAENANGALFKLTQATGRSVVGDAISLRKHVDAPQQRVVHARISEALPFVSVLREIDTTLPPG